MANGSNTARKLTKRKAIPAFDLEPHLAQESVLNDEVPFSTDSIEDMGNKEKEKSKRWRLSNPFHSKEKASSVTPQASGSSLRPQDSAYGSSEPNSSVSEITQDRRRSMPPESEVQERRQSVPRSSFNQERRRSVSQNRYTHEQRPSDLLQVPSNTTSNNTASSNHPSSQSAGNNSPTGDQRVSTPVNVTVLPNGKVVTTTVRRHLQTHLPAYAS